MNEIPPAVRILPMDAALEFDGVSAGEVQQTFFLLEFPAGRLGGKYEYRAQGLDAASDTVVLFQYDSNVIASAVLDRVERYEKPQGSYSGAMFFDVTSIRVFDPIGAQGIRQVWPEFKRFSQSKQSLDPSKFPIFAAGLSRKREPPIARDIVGPPNRERILVSRVIRDSALAREIKELHSYKCQICGYSIERPDGSSYAEGHHLKPLGKPHNGLDVRENIICLCPNHHAACDLGAISLSVSDLRKAPSHIVAKEFIDYHNDRICGEAN